jgi:Zn-dependent metalloprotease
MSKYQMIKHIQPSKWILPVFLMFHGLFGENVNRTALSSKPVKSSKTVQKPTISDLQVLGERLKEVMEETSQNQQFQKGSNSSLSQSLTGLRDSPISLTRQIKKTEFKSKFNVSWNKINDTPVFITGSELSEFSSQFSGASSAEEIAKEFISTHKEVFQLEDSYAELETVKEFNDRYGKTHVKFQQVYQGIPVWGKTVVSHFEPEGDLYLINARFSPSPKDLDPSQINYLKEQAIQIALDDIGTFSTVAEFNDEMKGLLSYDSPVGKQYIWIDEDGHTPHLIWHVQVRPNAVDNWYYFIDANTGYILEKYNNTQTDGHAQGTATDLNGETQTVHSYQIGSWYYMIDGSRSIWQGGDLPGSPLGGLWTLRYQDGSLYYVYSNNANTWEPVEVSAHSNTGSVFQYFYDTFGRQAIDGDGSTIISVVNVTTSSGEPMDNAYWNGAYMAYGDGNTYFTPLAGALDVAAHEMTHGIVERTVGLEYKFQSGALNESFADIFGAMVDRDDWRMGENVVNTQYYPSGALRDLSDPNQGGTTYSDPGWQPAHWDEFLDWDITYDNGGVHYNSGIPNKACYLIAESIGREKTEQIYYKILEAEYLNSQGTFVDMRLAAIQAAGELYGNDEVAAVMSAFDAVGIVGDVGSSAPEDSDPVQGEQWIAAINNDNGDHSLLRVNPDDDSVVNTLTNTQVFTGTGNPLTINNAGTIMFFVSSTNDIIGISTNGGGESNITETTLPGIWHSIALAPDLSKFAATTIGEDSTIYIFDLVNLGTPTAVHLYSPTTVEGVNSEVVVYADALDFDPSSTYLIYDAFNRVPQNDGPDLEYWDVAILDVVNEIIFPVFGALPSGISMGNPSFAQTNGNYFVLDYIDQNSETVWILARDLFEGGFGWIEYNGSKSSFPRYSPDDTHLIFQRTDGDGSTTLRTLALSDKITADGPSSEFTSNRLLPSWFVIEGQTNSVDENSLTPGRFTLDRNYPNPFNPVTHVEFQIPYDVQVKVSVTDITGREIRVLENSRLNSGAHRVMWDGRDRFGKNVSAGIYLCHVKAGDQIHTGKMLLLK